MVEINNKADYDLDVSQIRQIVEKFLVYFHQEKAEVSVALVDNPEIRELNKAYRGKDQPTDVLSFPAEEPDNFLGEVIINYQQVSRQAPDFDNSPQEELVFILIHGLLHLLGYTDDTEESKQEMVELGGKIIRELNISL